MRLGGACVRVPCVRSPPLCMPSSPFPPPSLPAPCPLVHLQLRHQLHRGSAARLPASAARRCPASEAGGRGGVDARTWPGAAAAAAAGCDVASTCCMHVLPHGAYAAALVCGAWLGITGRCPARPHAQPPQGATHTQGAASPSAAVLCASLGSTRRQGCRAGRLPARNMAAQRSAAQHGATRHGTARHGTARHGAARAGRASG